MKKLTAAQKKDIGDYFVLGCFGVFIFGMIGMHIYADSQLVSNKNVIVENSDNKLVVRDVNTNEERIVEIIWGYHCYKRLSRMVCQEKSFFR